MLTDHLFVYGTLRRGADTEFHPLLKGHVEYIGRGVMPGRLYDLGDYPGLLLSSRAGEQVVGEVYRLARQSALLKQLDRYEECSPEFPEPREYARQCLPVLLPELQVTRDCWVYVYQRSVEGRVLVGSGDYCLYKMAG